MQASAISADVLGRLLESFLADAPHAVVLENGELLFDFATARYSVSGEGKCVLHLWSDERNTVRRVLDAELRPRLLRLSVLRFGQSQPTVLEISADRDQRSATALRAIRSRYKQIFERVLLREFHGYKLESVSNRPDLEHSCSPVYTRGLLRQGQSAFAVLGVSADETQPSIDAALTFGILWMHRQREQLAGRAHVAGLKLFAPAGRSQMLRQRMSHLNRDAARWELYAFDERAETCAPLDCDDSGNLATRLARAVDARSARERFAASIARMQAIEPASEAYVESPTEIVFRLYGLEFARAKLAPVEGSFRNIETITFGLWPAEHTLDQSNEDSFRDLVIRLAQRRSAGGDRSDPLFRLCPERWLESLIIRDVRSIDERLDPRFVYSQVPAFASTDRAMLDVLTCTLEGRLAILELKADEDIHLPLQGLDYWARVRYHQREGGFLRHGYFAGRELSDAPPLLYFVAPALRTHPATDTLLRYLTPQIQWSVAQIDERWRESVRVINRKHPQTISTTDLHP
ncbi:MAG TPA: hypothetical protein VE779_12405 [Candidatus Angelobacter sp.]|nr:hypothetical protein [Candidatus Angelobacter sp.]